MKKIITKLRTKLCGDPPLRQSLLADTDWQSIKMETAVIFIDLAEKRLAETNDTAKLNSERVDKVLTVWITLVTAILSYLGIDGWDKFGTVYFNTALCILFFMLLAPLVLLVLNLFPAPYGTIGEEPKHIMHSGFVDNFEKEGYKENAQTLNLICSICECYQNKITDNGVTNARRVARTKWAIILIIVSLLTSFLLARWVL